ncbi:MAG: 16S rRNA (cytidine(1402)-2'-O)-methyltransferase [Thermoleophilia bacterium]|nr:16S rRNA (cytidine(1402)-2'-O)-methyltransferase [Thermoleophilia bacterium]
MLYICPTPIGNLEDVTLRVLEVLRKADVVACEDTRHTGILLKRHGIVAGELISFHEHNEEQRIQRLLPLLRQGKDVAVVSDAGMPGLSDPGFSLVRACIAEDLPVTVLPGPSAVSTALVLSGFPVDRFAFVGFLARSRAKLLEQLTRFESTGATLVAFESPRRTRASVATIGERWPGRPLAVCRELTKLHEQVVRGTAAEVLEHLSDPMRGEIVLVIAPSGASESRGPANGGAAAGDAEARARSALADLERLGVGTKNAASVVAGLTGFSPRWAYELALEVKKARIARSSD